MVLNSKGSVLLGSNGNATVERLKVQTSASGSSQFATTRKHLPQNFSPGRPASPAAPPPVGGRRCSWRRGSAKLDSAACAGAKVPFGYRCFVVLKENPKGMPRSLGTPQKDAPCLFSLNWIGHLLSFRGPFRLRLAGLLQTVHVSHHFIPLPCVAYIAQALLS